jgi:methylated-DNA-[protein]-cysteine S-methyltransferase
VNFYFKNLRTFYFIYPTPENFDDILLTSDGKILTGLHFVKQYKASFEKKSLPIFQEVSIPFGKTMTYGEIAALIAKKHGIEKMSAQADGGAVGKNPIGIIIPCHRVLGSGKSLTGYSGGIKNKIGLLKVERIEFLEE